jgi:hypothetical protein
MTRIKFGRAPSDCADANRTGDATGAIGTGIAFDGTNLLLSCWSDNTIVEVSPWTARR